MGHIQETSSSVALENRHARKRPMTTLRVVFPMPMGCPTTCTIFASYVFPPTHLLFVSGILMREDYHRRENQCIGIDARSWIWPCINTFFVVSCSAVRVKYSQVKLAKNIEAWRQLRNVSEEWLALMGKVVAQYCSTGQSLVTGQKDRCCGTGEEYHGQ